MSASEFRRWHVIGMALAAVLSVAGVSLAGDEPSALEKALGKMTELEFEGEPLSDVTDFIKATHGIKIQIDKDVMTDSFGDDFTVNCMLEDVTLSTALKSVLAPFGLTYVVADDVVMITSQDKASDLSRRSIASWPHQRAAEAKIEEALEEKTDLDFTDQPLSDVIEYLKSKHEIEVQFDTKALADARVGSDTTVTRNLKGVTLRSALSLVLGDLELDYVIRDEVLLITSKNAMRTMRELRVYPIYDLIVPPGQAPDVDDDELDRDYQPLIAAVRSALGKDAEADIHAYPLTGSLIVNASVAGQLQVRKLFDLLRQVRRQQAMLVHLPE